MNGATLAVLAVEWERAWSEKDFDMVARLDQARHVIEGLPREKTEEAAPTSDSVFFIKVSSPLPETAPPQRFQLDCRTFVPLNPFTR
jgi:hypothetical protein